MYVKDDLYSLITLFSCSELIQFDLFVFPNDSFKSSSGFVCRWGEYTMQAKAIGRLWNALWDVVSFPSILSLWWPKKLPAVFDFFFFAVSSSKCLSLKVSWQRDRTDQFLFPSSTLVRFLFLDALTCLKLKFDLEFIIKQKNCLIQVQITG